MSPQLPPLVICETDYDSLFLLSERTAQQLPKVSAFLAAELERADVLPVEKMPNDVVMMRSRAVFRMVDSGTDRTVTLVYPAEADIQKDKLSILTPVGTALLGMSAGQTMSWRDRAGATKSLIVKTVLSQPSPSA